MLGFWDIFALGLSSIAGILLAAAVWLHVRVLGRMLALEMDLTRHTLNVEQLDTRITREVKARAGLARAADAEDERTLLQQAQDGLSNEGAPVVPLARPKRILRRG